jgi:hypothetical protein
MRKHHARSAFRAAESLNCEQRDCGWVIGHCIPPLGQAGAQNSQSPVDAEEGGDGTSMLFRVRRHRSILLTFKKLMIGKLGRPCLFRVQMRKTLIEQMFSELQPISDVEPGVGQAR